MKEQQSILNINLVIEKLRKHFALYNFFEQIAPITYTQKSQKVFAINPIITDKSIDLNVAIRQPKNIFDDAWLIKILDTFFSETLLLDMYTLKINFLGCLKDQASKKLCSSCQKEWNALTNTLQILSISFIVDPSLHIPGENTSKTQFEFSVRSTNKTNALAHGSQITPSPNNETISQAQINVDTILSLDQKLTLPPAPAIHVIVPLSQSQNNLALLVASTLHHHGKCVDVVLNFTTAQERLEYAHKMNAQYLLLLGDDEQAAGTVTIKNLIRGTQEVVKQTKIIESLLF